MKVALSMRVTGAVGYHEPRDSISHDWLSWLRDWNMTPFPIPNILADPAGYLSGIAPDLLVLTGGDDIGATPERDAAERAMIDWAISGQVPVLGVCRGLQLINSYFGGTTAPVSGHVATRHRVRLGGAFARYYGPEISTNSYHNQGIAPEGVGATLVVGGVDDDGHVEALHHDRHPIWAVMWHPERDGAPAGDVALMREMTARTGAKTQ